MNEELLTKKEIAKFFKMTVVGIDAMTEEGMPIEIRIGKNGKFPRYKVSACVQWHKDRYKKG